MWDGSYTSSKDEIVIVTVTLPGKSATTSYDLPLSCLAADMPAILSDLARFSRFLRPYLVSPQDITTLDLSSLGREHVLDPWMTLGVICTIAKGLGEQGSGV